MSVFITLLIGICLLVVFFLMNMGVIAVFSSPEDKEAHKGCGTAIVFFCVVIVVLYSLRSCVS